MATYSTPEQKQWILNTEAEFREGSWNGAGVGYH